MEQIYRRGLKIVKRLKEKAVRTGIGICPGKTTKIEVRVQTL